VHDPEADVKQTVRHGIHTASFQGIDYSISQASAYVTFAFRTFPTGMSFCGILVRHPYLTASFSIAIKVDHLEIIFIRLLHLLAHHPDFVISHEELPDIAK
jgi:hypothetical protein